MKIFTYLACIFSCIGAINWGLVTFLNFNLVEFSYSYIPIPKLNLVLYAIIAFSGFYLLMIHFLYFNDLPCCRK